MFEPACRGGSKRSLNISNPTPKWPRSPGEMVSAPARGADTRAHARSHPRTPGTHAHAAGSRAHRPAAAAPLSLETRRIFFCCFFLFNFQFASAGLPCAPGKANTYPGGIFPELQGPPRRGERALRPCASVPALPGSGSQDSRSRGGGPGVPRGGGQRRSAPTRAGVLRSPRRARGPRPGLRRPALLLAGRKLTPCSVPNSEHGELPAPPTPPHSRSTWVRTAEWGAFRGSELQEDGNRCRGARA